jgi:hypothetical protein
MKIIKQFHQGELIEPRNYADRRTSAECLSDGIAAMSAFVTRARPIHLHALPPAPLLASSVIIYVNYFRVLIKCGQTESECAWVGLGGVKALIELYRAINTQSQPI